MEQKILEVGVGGIVALLMVREVLTFVQKRKNGYANNGLGRVADEVHWLKEIHDQRDADGVPVWYVRRSLEDAIRGLSDNVANQTELMREMVKEIKTISARG